MPPRTMSTRSSADRVLVEAYGSYAVYDDHEFRNDRAERTSACDVETNRRRAWRIVAPKHMLVRVLAVGDVS